MIFIGIDDTDTLETPGTNQLARHLVRDLADVIRGRIITPQHQLLEDSARAVHLQERTVAAAIECELVADVTTSALAT